MDAGLEGGALALLLDDVIHLAAGLLHHVLDAGGMDAAVGDELLQGDSRHLAADGVEAGHGDGLGGVVDDEIDAGDGLEGADVAALAADDAALHLVVGQGHHGYRRLRRVVGGAALDGDRDDFTGVLIGLLLVAGLDLLDLHGLLVGDLGFDVLEQIGLGVLLAQAGDALQDLHLALLEEVDLLLGGGDGLLLLAQVLLLALEGVELLVQGLFLLLEAALLLLQVGAALLDFLFVFCARFMDLLLGFHKHFALLVFAGFDGFIDNTARFGLGVADLALGDLLAVADADQEEHDRADQKCRDGQHNVNPFHNSNTPPF